MRALRSALFGALALVVGVAPLAADVVRVVIEQRTPVWDGYELLRARLHFSFDPDDPADAAVVDLALAPRNAEGLVEAQAMVWVLQPIEPQRRRGLAWVDLDALGVGPAAPLFEAARQGAPLPDAGPGDGLLLEEGLTLIQLAPEGSGVPRVTAPEGGPVPALDPDGAELIGWVRARWQVSEAVERLTLDGADGWHHPVMMPEAPVHRLFEGPAGAEPTDTVPGDDWRFVATGGGDAQAIERDGGFEAGRVYELVYRAREPRVQGLALAVLRDVMAYARYGVRSEFAADRGIAFGSGVGARLLRAFLYDGFNDASGRMAFDALWMHGAGAGRGDINRRFARPGQDHHLVDLYPFTLGAQFDPVTGLDEGLLPAGTEGSIPRTITSHAGADYHTRAASLTHTAVDGLSDRPPPDGHRAYHLSGEGADPGPAIRALARAAVHWVIDDLPMPPSRLPSVGAGTLVRPSAVALPGDPESHSTARMVYREDPGPRFRTEGIADRLDPERGTAFPVLVPQVDGLGNPLGGVRPLELRVPLLTYRPGGPPMPLPETRTEGDPRPDLQSLYGSEAGFLARVRAAAEALIRDGFLLERDRALVIAAARERWQRLITPRDR